MRIFVATLILLAEFLVGKLHKQLMNCQIRALYLRVLRHNSATLN
jgi:hypothetical protein